MLNLQAAQQSVHWTGGMRTAKLSFFCPEDLPYNEHYPPPTHQQVTQAVMFLKIFVSQVKKNRG